MGRQKKEEALDELSYLDKIDGIVKKDYGQGIFVSGTDVLDKKIEVVPVCPSLNVGFGGGVPEGSWFVLAGKYKCGKTTTLLHFARNAQRMGKVVFYGDVEGRLKRMNLESIPGLDIGALKIIRSSETKILTAQDYLKIFEDILKNHPRCVLIIDSFSCLCHEKEANEGVGTSTRGGTATLLSQFCRQMSNVVPVMGSIVCGVTQLMANTSGYGASIMEKGGNAVQYQGDCKIKCKSVEPWTNSKEKKIGQIVTWIVEYAALPNTLPGTEVKSYIRYGQGIDEVQEIIEFGRDFNLITGKGWYCCEFMKNHLEVLKVSEWNEDVERLCKAQGEEKLYKLLSDNPEWMKILEKEVLELLNG